MKQGGELNHIKWGIEPVSSAVLKSCFSIRKLCSGGILQFRVLSIKILNEPIKGVKMAAIKFEY